MIHVEQNDQQFICDEEQTISTNVLLRVMCSRREVPLITHGNVALGKDPPWLLILRPLNEGMIEPRKGDIAFTSLT